LNLKTGGRAIKERRKDARKVKKTRLLFGKIPQQQEIREGVRPQLNSIKGLGRKTMRPGIVLTGSRDKKKGRPSAEKMIGKKRRGIRGGKIPANDNKAESRGRPKGRKGGEVGGGEIVGEKPIALCT